MRIFVQCYSTDINLWYVIFGIKLTCGAAQQFFVIGVQFIEAIVTRIGI